jgi:hypothetical protein
MAKSLNSAYSKCGWSQWYLYMNYHFNISHWQSYPALDFSARQRVLFLHHQISNCTCNNPERDQNYNPISCFIAQIKKYVPHDSAVDSHESLCTSMGMLAPYSCTKRFVICEKMLSMNYNVYTIEYICFFWQQFMDFRSWKPLQTGTV